ncbi:DUF3291 domain-containing protein [Svornostia abyssi]|uniref:DUF3291 domain-containing protein n=1 Tax=Svornostia abyssi TaxID=2898438 RepID=A0ABY5PK20_9ACTN|nr:DUF3291 domain-containing protein [Parviterribacteraceae bacterium J379]
MAFHLAQVNIGDTVAPTDSPQLADFMNGLDHVNAQADAAPGFVWRLQTEEGNATDLRVFDGAALINMSVWESLETLRAFVYENGDHRAYMRRRREWFVKSDLPFQCLWWVPAGHIPSLEEAEERLTALRDRGPTPFAFTFRERFSPGGSAPVRDARELCDA